MSHTGDEPVAGETMMSPMDFTEMGSNMTALIHGVMQTNLRAMLEFSRADNPQAFADLQRRFAREYMAALQHGIMTLVSVAAYEPRSRKPTGVAASPRPPNDSAT
jgi:hypothetical protein